VDLCWTLQLLLAVLLLLKVPVVVVAAPCDQQQGLSAVALRGESL